MKKSLIKFCIMLGIVTVSLLGLSSFNQVNAMSTEFTGSEFELVDTQNYMLEDNVITPYSTWTGNLGTSRLDYMKSNQAFAWGINIKKKTPIVFAGTIKIYTQSTGSHRGTIYISGSGIGSAGGLAYIPSNIKLQKRVLYKAEYSGNATGGGSVLAWIPKNASIPFTY